MTRYIYRPKDPNSARVWENFEREVKSAGRDMALSVEPHEEPRTLEQNSKLWAMLGDISDQQEWFGKKRSPEVWKDLFTAALVRAEVLPGIDGGFVTVGLQTSKMSKKRMAELIEVMYVFGAEKGVVWTEPEEVEA